MSRFYGGGEERVGEGRREEGRGGERGGGGGGGGGGRGEGRRGGEKRGEDEDLAMVNFMFEAHLQFLHVCPLVVHDILHHL